jgi:hypothetical protein
MKVSKTERARCLAELHKILQPGDTVFTILDNVSRSGMARDIRLVVMKDGADLHPNYLVSQVIGVPQAMRNGRRQDALRMRGCGMDMGFEIVYQLGMALWPNGTDKPHGQRNGEPDSNGGYALKQRWL